MNIRGLQRRLARIEEAVRYTSQRQERGLVFKADEGFFCQYAEGEREQIRSFLSELKTRYGGLFMQRLTDNELHQLSSWFHLYDALQKGDEAGARRYRLRLAISYEELVIWFLALDISHYPDNIGYPVSQVGYRYIRASMGRGHDEYDNMLAWYEHYHQDESTPAA